MLPAALLVASTLAAGTAEEPPPIESIGALAFGPGDVLFLGDGHGGRVHALRLGERQPPARPPRYQLLDVEARLAAVLGTHAEDVLVHDLAVDPVSLDLWLALSHARRDQAHHWQVPNEVAPGELLLRITPDLALEPIELEALERTVIELPNPVEDAAHRWKPDTRLRGDTITDMAFVDDELLVSGLSSEAFAAALWRIEDPLGAAAVARCTTLEIFHGPHEAWESHAPIRSFVACELGGQPALLAAYLCTPFVTFPLEALADGAQVRGRTVAELGWGNQPIDMIAYARDGDERLLIANSNLPMMVLRVADLEACEEAITAHPEAYTAGVEVRYRPGTGVQQMARLDAEHAVVLQRMGQGKLCLFTWPLERF